MNIIFKFHFTYVNKNIYYEEKEYLSYSDAYNEMLRVAGRRKIQHAVIGIYAEFSDTPILEVFYDNNNKEHKLRPFLVKPYYWLCDTWCVPEFLSESCHENYMTMLKG